MFFLKAPLPKYQSKRLHLSRACSLYPFFYSFVLKKAVKRSSQVHSSVPFAFEVGLKLCLIYLGGQIVFPASPYFSVTLIFFTLSYAIAQSGRPVMGTSEFAIVRPFPLFSLLLVVSFQGSASLDGQITSGSC